MKTIHNESAQCTCTNMYSTQCSLILFNTIKFYVLHPGKKNDFSALHTPCLRYIMVVMYAI